MLTLIIVLLVVLFGGLILTIVGLLSGGLICVSIICVDILISFTIVKFIFGSRKKKNIEQKA